jgi:hypothetical protein
MPSIVVALMLAAVLPTTGCAKIQGEKKSQALEATLSAYQSALRWGYYETAWAYLAPELRKAPTDADWAERIRVVGYDVVQPAALRDETTAEQIVRIDYVDETQQIMHGLVDRQTWHYDPDAERWWLSSGLPPFE